MIRSALFLLPLLAIGCATPTSGDYLFEETSTTTDCPDSGEDTGGDETENEPVTITVSEDKATVTISDIDCPLDGTSFECIFADEETDYNESGMDAIVGIYSDLVGTWVSSSKINATSFTEVTCTGTACADLEAMGTTFCSATVEMSGTLEK
ncbi:MAG: hypothetical protein ACK4YP_00490 [Myxococcota bacterium]